MKKLNQRIKNNFKIEKLLKKSRLYYGLFLVVQILSYFLVGLAIDKFNLNLWSPKTQFDSHIPFLPFMIIPYSLYFFVMAAPFFLNLKKEEIKRLLLNLITASLLTYLISFSYSVTPSPRHIFSEQDSIFVFIIKILYKYDTSPIYFPSLHSLHSLLIGFHLWKKGGMKRNFLPCALLISLSTVFVKQHFVIDALASLFIAPVIYFFNDFILSLKVGRGKADKKEPLPV